MTDYPAWVCQDCGTKYGRQIQRMFSTWHIGDCGICGEHKPVTEPRDFGHLIPNWKEVSEQTEFFRRWHGERRKREKLAHDVARCYRMLLSEPDTKGALFKAENILREALSEANAATHNADVTGRTKAVRWV